MTLNQLRALLEIAKAGSLTAAAERMNISQPALGLRIRDLEAELGVKLFHRRSRGMALTEAGHELKHHAETVLAQVASAAEAMRRHAVLRPENLTLGTPPTPGKLLVPGLLRAVAADGRMSLRLREGLSSELQAWLASGEIDLAMSYAPAGDGLRSTDLVRDDLILIGPPGQLGGGTRPVPFAELPRYPLLMDSERQITRRLIDDLARRRNVRLNVVLEVESVTLKHEVVLSEGSFAIVPRGQFADAIDQGRFDWAGIADPGISRVLRLVSRPALPRHHFDAVLAMLAPLVQEHVRSGRVNWRALVTP